MADREVEEVCVQQPDSAVKKKDDVKCEGEADQFSQRQKPFTNISPANWTLGPRRNCFFIYNYYIYFFYIFFFLRTSRSDLCLAVLHP